MSKLQQVPGSTPPPESGELTISFWPFSGSWPFSGRQRPQNKQENVPAPPPPPKDINKLNIPKDPLKILETGSSSQAAILKAKQSVNQAINNYLKDNKDKPDRLNKLFSSIAAACNERAAENGVNPGLDATFAKELFNVAHRLGIAPGWLLSVIDTETGSKYLPSKYKSSGAVGLLQFTPDGVDVFVKQGLFKNKDEAIQKLSNMSAKEQLKYVEKYLQHHFTANDAKKTFLNTYLAVFAPAFINSDLTQKLYSNNPTKQNDLFDVNKSLDQNGNGHIEAGELFSRVITRGQDLYRDLLRHFGKAGILK